MSSTDGVPCISGAVMTTGREVTRSIIGQEAYDRALASLPAALTAEYTSATPLTWVPLSVLEPAILAMGAAGRRDPLDLQDEVARITIERSLNSIWRVFLRLTSNEALLSRVPLVYAKSYNRGRVVLTFPASDRATVELLEWPDAPLHIIRTTGVGVEVMLRGAGRKNARVVYERTRTGARYQATELG